MDYTRAIGRVLDEQDYQVNAQRQGRFTYTPKDCPDDKLILAMVLEELGEVSRLVQAKEKTVQEKFNQDDLEKEIMQVAALSVSWMEGLEAR